MPDAGYVPKTDLELLEINTKEFKAYPPHKPFAGPFFLVLRMLKEIYTTLKDLGARMDKLENAENARRRMLLREKLTEAYARRGLTVTSCQLNKDLDEICEALGIK